MGRDACRSARREPACANTLAQNLAFELGEDCERSSKRAREESVKSSHWKIFLRSYTVYVLQSVTL